MIKHLKARTFLHEILNSHYFQNIKVVYLKENASIKMVVFKFIDQIEKLLKTSKSTCIVLNPRKGAS